MFSRNKYSGECYFCGLYAGAQDGFYFSGFVFCSEPVVGLNDNKLFSDGFTCLRKYNEMLGTNYESGEAASIAIEVARNARQKEYEATALVKLLNGELQSLAEEARVRSLDAVINKVVGQEIALADLNWEQAIQVSNELVKRIDQKKVRKHNKSLKEQNICNRCGGQGYSDNWVATGSVCYKCNGTGKAQ